MKTMSTATKNTQQKIMYGNKYIDLVERTRQNYGSVISELRDVSEKIRMKAIDDIYNATTDCADTMVGALGEGASTLSGFYNDSLKTASLVGEDSANQTKTLIGNLEPLAGIKGNFERITATRTGDEDFSTESQTAFSDCIKKLSSVRREFIEEFAAIGNIDTDDNFRQAHMGLGKKLETACNTLASYFKKLETTNAEIFALINSASAEAASEVSMGSLNVDKAADSVCKVNRNLNV